MATRGRRVSKKTIGSVERVSLSGAGQNSGEILIVLKTETGDVTAFGIWMNTPPKTFLKLLETAMLAMWDLKKVQVTSTPTDNLDRVIALEVLKKQR